MLESRVLPEILRLDPEKDHSRIVFLTVCYDFPWDTTRALEFALFRTFAVPSISELLDRTGEFGRRAAKRYDDTDIIVSELINYGYSSERGKAALRRMNQLHGRFAIANEDFLYVLSTFVFEPLRWYERYGWRQLVPAERQAMFHFWRQVGRRMNIREIPATLEEFEAFNRDYERTRFRYQESNQRVGSATRALFLSWVPAFLRPLGREVIHAMMDEPLRQAFGFPRPAPWAAALVPVAMALRAALIRWLPRRTEPFLRTRIRRDTYPHGYRIEELGPDPLPEPGRS